MRTLLLCASTIVMFLLVLRVLVGKRSRTDDYNPSRHKSPFNDVRRPEDRP